MDQDENNTVGDKADTHIEFFNTGRVGRRNALPDILGNHCTTTTADLPDQLKSLTTNDGSAVTTSVDTSHTSGASTSSAAASSSSSANLLSSPAPNTASMAASR